MKPKFLFYNASRYFLNKYFRSEVLTAVTRLLVVEFLLQFLFDTEDGGSTFLRIVGGLSPIYTVLQPRAR
jgi:ABC-type iron transport system FetAB permease component